MHIFDLEQVRKDREAKGPPWYENVRSLKPLLDGEFRYFPIIIVSVLINIGASVLTPYLISQAIDGPITEGNISGLVGIVGGLSVLYVVASVASYFQARIMGYVSQRVLFRLRERLFVHLQTLPIAFFNQNKTGDLISRLSNDTEKINQFLSEGILRFTSLFFSVLGIAGMMLWLEWRMALVVFGLTGVVIVLSSLLNGWIRRLNANALEVQGNLSAEVQEGISNYRVLVAFRKQGFFAENFYDMSEELRQSKVKAETASAILAPIYTFGSNISQGLVLIIGTWFVVSGEMTIGVLVGFIAYTQKFFDPLRILGAIIGTMQAAIAGWGRVNDVLSLQTNLDILSVDAEEDKNVVLSMDSVSFQYSNGETVIKDVSLNLCPGKTYALVGPTGGGKSTTASLMARLYDPTKGVIRLNGRDIRSYDTNDLAQMIGFILQEPIIFAGTLADNLLYGNDTVDKKSLGSILEEKGLNDLIESFPEGLETEFTGKNQVSLGQKQLVSFIRAVLREPSLLILDEATANIDTVTEKKLQRVLDKLPETTTKVVIAHRLTTIKDADAIYFVGGDRVELAGSFEEVLEKLEA